MSKQSELPETSFGRYFVSLLRWLKISQANLLYLKFISEKNHAAIQWLCLGI